MWRTFAAVLLLLGLVACESLPAQQVERSLAGSRESAPAKIDAEECRAKGGTIRRLGMLGTPSCVTPFPDGGKACRSSSECTGDCFAPEGTSSGQVATGTCQMDTAAMFGCHIRIEEGVAGGGLCVD